MGGGGARRKAGPPRRNRTCCSDAAAIRHLVTAADLTHARTEIIEVGDLSRFERPMPVIAHYDGLLSQEVGQ